MRLPHPPHPALVPRKTRRQEFLSQELAEYRKWNSTSTAGQSLPGTAKSPTFSPVWLLTLPVQCPVMISHDGVRRGPSDASKECHLERGFCTASPRLARAQGWETGMETAMLASLLVSHAHHASSGASFPSPCCKSHPHH